MACDEKERQRRRHHLAEDDQRAPFERDRDRILYSSAFHRLAGVTQIVRAGEADVFHTRQQHSVKVAQVGRRLAQRCRAANPDLAAELGVHEEVVEAACLAHDLGHPPFGHVGESTLNDLVEGAGDSEGFEGNAQSFRIITKLAVRFHECHGLDLTRATLAACLKYPWMRNTEDPKKKKKWSVYQTEEDDFRFAREFCDGENQSTEAALMDWADDIAYSVHDLEDFHRCGALPWYKILDESSETSLVQHAYASWFGAPPGAEGMLRESFRRLKKMLTAVFSPLINEPYTGTRPQRQQLRTLTSQLIGRYIHAADLVNDPTGVAITRDYEAEVRVLKQITKDYIIATPSLLAQQHGQKLIVNQLFAAIKSEAKNGIPGFLPPRLHYLYEHCPDNQARFTADCIASLSEHEAVRLHSRLYGASSGSVLDPIVR